MSNKASKKQTQAKDQQPKQPETTPPSQPPSKQASRTGSGLIVIGLLSVVVVASIAGVFLLTSAHSPLKQVINDTFDGPDIELKDDTAKSVVARTQLGRKQNARIEIIDQDQTADEETIKSERVAVSSLSPTAILAAEAQQKLITTVSQLEGEVRSLQTALQTAQNDINRLEASPNQLPYMRQKLNMLALEQAMLRGEDSAFISQQIAQMVQSLSPSGTREALVALANHVDGGYTTPYQIMALSTELAQLDAPKAKKEVSEAKTFWQKIKQFFARLVAVEVKSDAQKQADKAWVSAKNELAQSLRTMAVRPAQKQLQTDPLADDDRLDSLREVLSVYAHQQALIERAQERIRVPQPTKIEEVK